MTMSPVEIIEWISAISGGLGALWTAHAKVVKPVTTVAEGVQQLQAELAVVKSKVLPNGGTSLIDAVNRIEDRLTRNEARDRLTTLDAPYATFDTDAQGRAVGFNRTYLRWAGAPKERLLGSQWRDFVDPADRSRVVADWALAVEEQREFTSAFRCVNMTTGETFSVIANGYPLCDRTKTITGWYGILTRTD